MTSEAWSPGEAGDDWTRRLPPATGRALVTVPGPRVKRAAFRALGPSYGIVAGTVAVVMGFGFVAGTALFAGHPKAEVVAVAARAPDPMLDDVRRLQGEVRTLKASLDALRSNPEAARQDEVVRNLKRSVDGLRQDVEGVRSASSGAVGQLSAKLDRLDRDPGPKLAELSARLDKVDREPAPKLAELSARLDKIDREPGQKLAEIASRVDRIERQVASADETGSLPPSTARPAPMPPQRAAMAAPVAAAAPPARPDVALKVDPAAKPKADVAARSEAPPRPEVAARAEPAARLEAAAQPEAAARPATLEGWMLRDVYGGVALLEGRAGGLREVAPGEYIPGVGEIRAIERRGRGWVVVTSRGIIQADNRW